MAINWQEINPRFPVMPGVSRTSRPYTPSLAPGKVGQNIDRMNGIAGGISMISQGFGMLSVKHRINSELERLSQTAETLIPKETSKGILAKIKFYEVRPPAGPSYLSFVSAFIAGSPANDPKTAFTSYINRDNLEAGVPKHATPVDMYFWGTRQ